MLTNDCGSDVLAGAEKDELWDWSRCACHCSDIAIQAALKEPVIEGCLAPLMALAHKFSYSRNAWNRFKKTQLKILKWEEERSHDKSDADYHGDEDFDVGREGQPRLKKVLRLLRSMSTRSNSMFYIIKRALALKHSLVMFSNSERAHNGKSPPPPKPPRLQSGSVVLESLLYWDPCPSF